VHTKNVIERHRVQCPRYDYDGGAEGSMCTLRMRWKDTGFSVYA
jgi:hypothetical protein